MLTINLKRPRLTLAVALGLLAIAGPVGAGAGAGGLRASNNEIPLETMELARSGQPRGIDVWETAGLRA